MRALVSRLVQFAFLLLSVLTVTFWIFVPAQPLPQEQKLCVLIGGGESCNTTVGYSASEVGIFILGSVIILLALGVVASRFLGSDGIYQRDSSGASLER